MRRFYSWFQLCLSNVWWRRWRMAACSALTMWHWTTFVKSIENGSHQSQVQRRVYKYTNWMIGQHARTFEAFFLWWIFGVASFVISVVPQITGTCDVMCVCVFVRVGRSDVRAAVVGPAASVRPFPQQARRRHPVRTGRDEALPAAQPPRLHHPQPRGQERRLRGGARRQMHNSILSS